MIKYRFATVNDSELIFGWANDTTARSNSYNSKPILYSDHLRWFQERVESELYKFYIFFDVGGIEIGMVRIEIIQHDIKKAFISIIVDPQQRGRGYAGQMIRIATDEFLTAHPDVEIIAHIFSSNSSSIRSFYSAGFILLEEKVIEGQHSKVLIRSVNA